MTSKSSKTKQDSQQPDPPCDASDNPRVCGLDVEQDMAIQKAEWRFQNIGATVMAVVVLLALLGLTGSGPLATAHFGTRGGDLYGTYQRFGRLESRMRITVEASPQEADGELRISASQDYLDKLRIETIQPTPVDVEVGNGEHVFVFTTPIATDHTRIIFFVRPIDVGPIDGGFARPGGPTVTFRHWILP